MHLRRYCCCCSLPALPASNDSSPPICAIGTRSHASMPSSNHHRELSNEGSPGLPPPRPSSTPPALCCYSLGTASSTVNTSAMPLLQQHFSDHFQQSQNTATFSTISADVDIGCLHGSMQIAVVLTAMGSPVQPSHAPYLLAAAKPRAEAPCPSQKPRSRCNISLSCLRCNPSGRRWR